MSDWVQEEMIRRFSAILGLVALLCGLVIPSVAVDIPDEQLLTPRPPVENTGGYSGAYYDDQRTLFRAFTYVEAWKGENYATSGATTCLSSQEEPCKSSNYLFFETPLSPCSVTRTRDCVVSLSGRIGENPLVSATLVDSLTSTFPNMGMEALKRYNTPFTGDIQRGVPDSGKVSLWTISGMKHQGGDLFMLIPKLNAEFQNVEGTKTSNLDVGLYPVSKVSSQGVQLDTCFFVTATDCYKRWPFPQNASFEVSIKTGAKIVGWFHGRLSSPEISSEKTSDGQTLINISGSVISVPTLAVWAKNSDLPPRLDEMIQEEFVQRGNQFAGVAYYLGNPSDRSTQAVIDERNPSFNDNFFERYMLWVQVAKDKAYATVSTWSFRTMQDYAEYAKCIGDSGVAGMVTTNSNAYIAGPPKFVDGDLAYRVASPHYDSKGEIQIGTYDLAIRSDVARCIYGFSKAPIQATLSVIYADGVAKNATTLVSEKNNWLRLSAKGFTYSSPTIKVKLSQEAPAPTPVTSPAPSPATTSNTSQNQETPPVAQPTATPNAVSSSSTNSSSKSPVVIAPSKKTTITCVKGKLIKKVTAVSPKCPVGYKKK
ncbi:MAG: hypothetical protein ACKOFJ_00215 [Actinomycetota bacterium]